MKGYLKLLPALLLPLVLLAGCGGGKSINEGMGSDRGSDSDGGTTTTGGTGGDGVSYLPLMVYESYKEYSGAGKDGVFITDFNDVYVEGFLINPVDSATLNSITTARTSDYTVKVDDTEIADTESFPMLQKVIGMPTYLRTALVFDVSGSMKDVDIQQLVNEAKDYISAVRANSNPVIANQGFTVWVFADEPEELTSGFTYDDASINNALDQVVGLYDTVAHGYGSSIHRAVVESIGRFTNTDYHFAADGNNDLQDYTNKDGIYLSQLVVFSSGSETVLEFSTEAMTKAIKSQAFVKYTAASSSSTTYLYKPVFYYVVGGAAAGEPYKPLSELAENSTNLLLVAGEYNFANGLVNNQIKAINRRVDLGNQYVYRFALIPRVGAHKVIFTSKSTQNSYSLTSDIKKGDLDATVGTPIEELTDRLIEITGPNGEYISNAFISLSEANTFKPATRWTVDSYGASDYSWNLVNGTGTTNTDGSFTVTSITAPAYLQLTNTTIGNYTTVLTIVD